MIPFDCNKTTYCDFIVTLSDAEVQKEVCRRCGRRVFYRKIDGQIDNIEYLRDHVRDFCQPQGATAKEFEHCYGHEAIMKDRRALEKRRQDCEKAERAIEEGKLEVMETLKIWKRLSSRGFTEKEIKAQL